MLSLHFYVTNNAINYFPNNTPSMMPTLGRWIGINQKAYVELYFTTCVLCNTDCYDNQHRFTEFL